MVSPAATLARGGDGDVVRCADCNQVVTDNFIVVDGVILCMGCVEEVEDDEDDEDDEDEAIDDDDDEADV